MSVDRIEQLREQGVALMMAARHEEALPFFDKALSLGPEEETRDLLIVNKASVHLYLKLNTPEVQQLPQIMLRRPKLRGLAAYHLATKFENEQDYKRARFYLDTARKCAESNGDDRLKIVTLIDLGNVCACDSKFDEAIVHFEAALAYPPINEERTLWHAMATQSLGYCQIMIGQPETGLRSTIRAVELLQQCGAESYLAEAYIDLCLAYLELGQLEEARHFGERGLAQATEARQIRNAHYLLGEVAYKAGDIALATSHFEKLAAYYPDFPQLTNVLFALDLRKMVNFRL